MTRKWIAALALVGAALVSLGTAAPAYAGTAVAAPASGGGGGHGENHGLGDY